jgi:hypothetical protein
MGILEIENTDTDEGPCTITLRASAVFVELPAMPLSATLMLGLLLGLTLRSIRSL